MKETTFTQISERLSRGMRRALEIEAGSRQLDLPTDAGDDALHELFGAEPPLALVAFETPGIQRYVFKVRRPVDVYGGSLLIADFTREDSKSSVYRILSKLGLPEEGVVYAGGGGGLILAPARHVRDLRQALEKGLSRATDGDLRTVTSALAVWPEDLSDARITPVGDDRLNEVLRPRSETTRYAATVAALLKRLSRERSHQAGLVPLISADQQEKRCDACGERIGEVTFHPGGDDETVCRPCETRRKAGGWAKRDDEQARTFEELVGDEHYMAVLYADGANVGKAFQALESLAQHRALSNAVETAFDEAVRQVLDQLPELRFEHDKSTLRFQTPIRGGDDLVLVLPAKAAFPAARALIPAIEKHFSFDDNELLRKAFPEKAHDLRERIAHFGVGVGIVFASFHFPIQFLVEYAHDLLDSAKRRIHENGCRSAVDFMVLRSGNPLNSSIAKLRENHYQRKPRGRENGLLFTRRPYTFEELKAFLKRADALAENVPRSQIHAMRQEVLRGYTLSRSLWLYQHARSRQRDSWAAYRDALGVSLEKVDTLLWEDDSTRQDWKSTDLVDMVEVFDFLGRPRHRREAA